MTVSDERPSRLMGDLGRRRAGVEDDRLAVADQTRGLRADLSLLVDVLHVLERHRLDLARHRAQERAAMLASDMAVGFELLEVLADGRLGNRESGAEVAHPRAALLLEPVENLHPPRLGEQAVEIGIGCPATPIRSASRRRRGSRHRHRLARPVHERLGRVRHLRFDCAAAVAIGALNRRSNHNNRRNSKPSS